jgi:hypothetical protein
MPKGKADKIDKSYLSFEDAVKRAWEAESPEKDGKKPAGQAEDEQRERVKSGEENVG